MLHRLRCSKYWLEGDKKGQTEIFVENLNGYPDNIRYNGRDIFWIGLVSVRLLTPSFVSQSFCIIICFVNSLQKCGCMQKRSAIFEILFRIPQLKHYLAGLLLLYHNHFVLLFVL